MNKAEKLTKQVYSKMVEREWMRVVKDPFHLLEFNTTMRFLKKYLPKKGLILDAGGGPGRYTIELAKMGYNVVLLDLVKENLELAKKQIKKAKVGNKVRDITEGNIVDLSRFKDNSFDAVICLGGPLSHVDPKSNREKAIKELIRVAKKNAPIFISVMSRYGNLTQFPRRWPDEIKPKKHFEAYVLKGDDYLWIGKHFCHYFVRDELEELFKKQKNIHILGMVGLEGAGSSDIESLNLLHKKHPQAWRNWVDIHNKICTIPTIVDISQHMMIIGRKA